MYVPKWPAKNVRPQMARHLCQKCTSPIGRPSPLPFLFQLVQKQGVDDLMDIFDPEQIGDVLLSVTKLLTNAK